MRDFLAEVFGLLDLDWQDFVTVTDRFRRPAEVPALLGDASKARQVLGWQPAVSFGGLCRLMLESDLAAKGLSLEDARKKARTLKPWTR